MKKIKMFISAAVVLASVSGALAFKPFGTGSIYCIADANVNVVNQQQACTASGQPASTRIDYSFSTNPAHQTTNPCNTNFTPFDGSQANKCLKLTPGTDRFVAVLP